MGVDLERSVPDFRAVRLPLLTSMRIQVIGFDLSDGRADQVSQTPAVTASDRQMSAVQDRIADHVPY